MGKIYNDPKDLKGTFRVSRVQSNIEDDFIDFELIDEASRLVICSIRMSIAEYGDLISGTRNVPCEIRLFETSRAGMTHEHKTEAIPRIEISNPSDEDLQAHVKPWEKDGWIASTRDLRNHHLWVGRDQVKVGFDRWVPPEEDIPASCECDNTHQKVDSVCRYCWSKGRRHWGDPEVE